MSCQLDKEDYTIGWICALPEEVAAAVAILDESHLPLPQDEGDNNAYQFGQVGHHNIVIVCMQAGVYGNTSAAVAVTSLRRSFPSITNGLMVGIGGGAPVLPRRDIRLGDVVVSQPSPGNGGVLQYDFGKTCQQGEFVQTGALNKPPEIYLTEITKLKADYLLHPDNSINNIIMGVLGNWPASRTFARPDANTDKLFRAGYDHPVENVSCNACDLGMVVERPPREQVDRPYIHYGLIASGNQVMKHGGTRDRLSREKGILCFEMEAAGLMDKLPSLVIRGICDYSDSHKNKAWQLYAALAAAAFAKRFLLQLSSRERDKKSRAQRYNLSLPTADGAAFGSYADQHESECLAGTRTSLLHQIRQWIEDPQGKCIFWMYGMAGTGKSTISRTLAKSLQAQSLYKNAHLGGSFFFKRSENSRSNAALFFTTIALQLADRFRSIIPTLQSAIEADPGISRKNFGEQFDKLIYRPLSELDFGHRSTKLAVVVVVDALDECERKEIPIVICLLAKLKDIEKINVRVFLTSRPDLPILPTFKKLSENTYENLVLHQVPEIEHDIELFLRHELSNIAEEHSLSKDWPGEEHIQKLIEMATPLFIYAATLCRFIGDENWDPNDRMKRVFEYQNSWQTSKLEKTYLPILDQLIADQDADEREELCTQFQQIVGTIINLASPLSITSIARLLSVPETKIRPRLNRLRSVLDIPTEDRTPVRTFHLSFRDFLLDPKLQGKSNFWINEQKTHKMIASRCIELMSGSTGVRRDICKLGSLGTLRSEISKEVIEQHLPPELQYACRYWVYHLQQGKDSISKNSQAYLFLRHHLLHWLEAISILGNMNDVLRMVDILSSVASVSSTEGIPEFLYDIRRFVLQNKFIIDKAPLQTYASAIIFAPKKSIIKSIFNLEKVAPWVCKLPQIQDEWDSSLQTLEGRSGWSAEVVFSPDGKTLASSGGTAVQLWDVGTGSLLQALEGSDPYTATALAFSPNGRVLVSGCSDGFVILWDVGTILLLWRLREHQISVSALAFSPNNEILASATNDRTIKLRDVETGSLLQVIEARTDRFYPVAFSPGGNTLASGSDDNTVMLLDTKTGSLLQTLNGHTDWVCSIAYSSDGKTLASASKDMTIRLWGAETGLLLQTINGHTDRVAFSPDGRTLASVFSDNTIRLWDAETGSPLQTLEGYENDVSTIKYSPDGRTLASASGDGTIRLWDTNIKSGSPLEMPREHLSYIQNLAFSPDGRTLASASGDETIKLWDVETGLLLQTQEGHKGWATAIAFSPDGETLASASSDETIRLWDANNNSGPPVRVLRHDKGRTCTVAFSPDGRILASGSADIVGAAIKLWGLHSGTLLYTLVFHTDWLEGFSVAFSSDSKTLASMSAGKPTNVWDIGTRARLEVPEQQLGTLFPPFRSGSRHEIGIKDEWVTRSEERLLWLPPSFRVRCSAFSGNSIALGHSSGRLSIFVFKFAT
ncbi:hypothetical protein TWF718_009722 [Orbilia javanica]|uniref:Uncharacterized protein n=1 Tax=Orbilia javanica TaxID=47235 RepID=A0AAN8MQ85_9PEZI